MIFDLKNEYSLLVEEAKKHLLDYPSAEQIVVVKTAKSNIRFFANNISDQRYEDEKKIVKELINEEDVVIHYIVCMWNDFNVDLPSMNFRKLLLDISKQNMYAKMYLGSRTMEIHKSMPQGYVF